MNFLDNEDLEELKRIGPKTNNERILMEALTEAEALETHVSELELELENKGDELGGFEDRLHEKDEKIDRLTDTVADQKEEIENLYKQLEEAERT